jgi:hypothetical protein
MKRSGTWSILKSVHDHKMKHKMAWLKLFNEEIIREDLQVDLLNPAIFDDVLKKTGMKRVKLALILLDKGGIKLAKQLDLLIEKIQRKIQNSKLQSTQIAQLNVILAHLKVLNYIRDNLILHKHEVSEVKQLIEQVKIELWEVYKPYFINAFNHYIKSGDYENGFIVMDKLYYNRMDIRYMAKGHKQYGFVGFLDLMGFDEMEADGHIDYDNKNNKNNVDALNYLKSAEKNFARANDLKYLEETYARLIHFAMLMKDKDLEKIYEAKMSKLQFK